MNTMHAPRLDIRRPQVAACVCLVLALILTLLASLNQARRNDAEAEQELARLSQRVVTQVRERMRLYEYGLRSMRGAYKAAGGLQATRSRLLSYSGARDIAREFPGARGFGVIRRVPVAQSAAFTAAAEADDWPGFAIRQLGPHDHERYVIQYIEPVARNLAAVGLDIASETNRRTAARSAMLSGETTLTGPITLVQATGKPSRSFLVMMPIYRDNEVPQTVVAREQATIAWSYAPLVIDEVLAGLDGTDGQITLALDDVTGGVVQHFYSSHPVQPDSADATRRAKALRHEVRFPLFRRVWSAELHATPSFFAALRQPAPRQIAVAGLALSALLALLAYLFAQARLRKSQMSIDQSRHSAIIDGSADAIIGGTLDGIITDWNPGAERLFGYTAEQAVGQSASELLLPNERAIEDEKIRQEIANGDTVPAFDTTRQRRDDSLIDVSLTAAPIFSAGRRCIGFSMTLRDTSEARQAQRELAALNQGLEAQVAERTALLDAALHDQHTILDAVPSMIGYWDKSLRNRVANRAYSEWFGQTADELRGRSMRDLLGEDIFASIRIHAEGALRGEAQSFERSSPAGDGIGMRHTLAHYIPDLVAGEVRGFYVLIHDVSELVENRLRLAAAQRDNEALLRTLDEHALVSEADAHGRITRVNNSFCRISGYSRDELVGQTHRIINSGFHPPSFWQSMWQTIQAGETWHGEVCNRASDGSLYWVDSIIAPFFGDQGNIEKYISIRTDVTARKRSEEALRVTNERFEIASNSAGIGVWELDVHSGVVSWDERMHAVYGIAMQSGNDLYKCWRDALHPEDAQRVQAEMGAALAGDQDLDTEFRIVRPDGEVRHLKAAARTARDTSGAAARMTGVNIDITDRVRVELESRQTSALLNAVLASVSQVAIIAVKANGIIDVFNRGAERLLGYDSGEVVGQHSALLFHDRDELSQRAALISEQTSLKIAPTEVLIHPSQLNAMHEWTYVRKGGRRVPVSLAITAMLDNQNELLGYVGIAQDVSAQKEYERSLREAVHEARRANQAKSQFLANMSHEIRTPMNAVIGMSHLLGLTTLNGEQANLLGKITVASKSLLGIINDILDLSKIEATELKLDTAPFRLRDALGAVSDLLRTQADARNIELLIDIADDVPDGLEGDAMRLRQILINLASNAVKFTERGSVRVAVSLLATGPGTSAIRFEVHDTGIGIDPAILGQLFIPFAQADASTTRRFGGTGLGLSIVKQLAALMGGEASATSTPGVGSVFRVDLPFKLHDGAAHSSPEPVAPPALRGAALRGLRLLLADDNDINLEVAQRILESEGAVVELAHEGQQVVDRLRAESADIDLVLLDIQMPVLDGHDTSRIIRNELKLQNLPIVALTAGTLVTEQDEARASGMDGFIGKPFEPAELIACIRRLVRPDANRRQANPDLAARRETPPAVAAASARPWPVIEGINADEAQMRLHGDRAFFLGMLRRLLRDFAWLQDAEQCTALPDDELSARLHSLKGSAGTLGAREIAAMAADAETACRRPERPLADTLIVSLADAMKSLCAHAEQILSIEPAAQSPSNDGSGGSATIRTNDVVRLLHLLMQFDLDAVDCFDDLASGLRAVFDAETFAKLRDFIETLQFPEAASLLEALLHPESPLMAETD